MGQRSREPRCQAPWTWNRVFRRAQGHPYGRTQMYSKMIVYLQTECHRFDSSAATWTINYVGECHRKLVVNRILCLLHRDESLYPCTYLKGATLDLYTTQQELIARWLCCANSISAAKTRVQSLLAQIAASGQCNISLIAKANCSSSVDN